MKSDFDFTGCNVFVAGGTSGINLGVAKAFAARGARVAVASRNPEKVEAAAAEVGSAAGPGLGYVFDVRDHVKVSEAFDAFAAEVGQIDAVISGAAGNFPAMATNISPNGFKSVMDIDVLGTFHVMKAAYPHMRRPGGSLINISAPQGQVPMAMQTHVCAAKAGVDMITRCLAVEWGPEGLRVNAVIPGAIADTEGMRRLAPTEAAMKAVAQKVPARRLGTPDDVAGSCLFLCSDAAAYVNGAIFAADGGLLQARSGLA